MYVITFSDSNSGSKVMSKTILYMIHFPFSKLKEKLPKNLLKNDKFCRKRNFLKFDFSDLIEI